MMPTTTKASAFRPSSASSLPTCGPTNSLRVSLSGSVMLPLLPASQTWRLMLSPLSVVICTGLTRPPSAAHSWAKTRPTTSFCLTPSRSGRRISTSREVPNFCTCTSPKFIASTVVRTRAMSALWAYSVSMTVPPVNSIDRCSPRVSRKNTASANVAKEMMLNTSACRMNGMSRRRRKNSMR